MTTREYLAGQALAGILANPENTSCSDETYARVAVGLADAMIEELARTSPFKPKEQSRPTEEGYKALLEGIFPGVEVKVEGSGPCLTG